MLFDFEFSQRKGIFVQSSKVNSSTDLNQTTEKIQKVTSEAGNNVPPVNKMGLAARLAHHSLNLQNAQKNQELEAQIIKDSRKIHEFEIAGLAFKIRSSQDEKTVQDLVAIVDHKVTECLAASKSGSLQSAAVLTALNLAEELMILKKKAIDEISQLELQTLKLMERIEQSKLPPLKN